MGGQEDRVVQGQGCGRTWLREDRSTPLLKLELDPPKLLLTVLASSYRTNLDLNDDPIFRKCCWELFEKKCVFWVTSFGPFFPPWWPPDHYGPIKGVLGLRT